MMRRQIAVLVIVVLSAGGAAACGSSKSTHSGTKKTAASASSSEGTGGMSTAKASAAEAASAATARNIADQAYSTLIACLVDKPTCQSADVVKMTAALAEPVRLGQGPGGLVIASQSADGKISRENYMITAYTSAKMALPDAPPDVISYTVMAQGSEDVRRCGPFYANQCVKGADGYGAWPKS